MEDKTCKQCNCKYTIADEDLQFYRKISPTFAGKTFKIPPPTLCPDCRRQRRLVWRDHKYLYKRECGLCKIETVTTYSKDKSFPVYCQDCWWSDRWEPLSYGRDFDYSRTLFEQFGELLNEVPRLALMNKSPENSEFCNNAGRNKNCYLCNGGCWDNENCAHGIRLDKCKDSVENRMLKNGELCLRCIFGENLYKCAYCHHCFNSKDCYFSVNLRGCDHCVFCSNLRNKSYFAFNKPCSEKEFNEIINKMSSYKKLSDLEQEFDKFIKEAIHPPVTMQNCEGCTGDYLYDSKNAIESYDAFNLENVKYLLIGEDCKDSMDVTSVGMEGSQLLYECMSTGVGAFNCMFGHGNWTAKENLYCDTLMSCSNCFVSSNLRQKQYCIFNKQYSKSDYEQEVARIVEYMQKIGEWGEYFPLNIAVFDYNESIAQEHYPLRQEEAISIGARWKKFDTPNSIDGEFYLPEDNVNAYGVNEISKLSEGIIKCELSGRPFKLNPVEIKFFIKNNIAIPRKHHEVRYDELGRYINPKKLWHRKCMCEQSGHDHSGKCAVEFETTYAPDRSEKVYCEKCYQQTVI